MRRFSQGPAQCRRTNQDPQRVPQALAARQHQELRIKKLAAVLLPVPHPLRCGQHPDRQGHHSSWHRLGATSYPFFHLGRHRVKSQVDSEATGEAVVASEVASEVPKKVAVEVPDTDNGVTAGMIMVVGQLAGVAGSTPEDAGQLAGVGGSVSPGAGELAGIGGSAGKFEQGITQRTGPASGLVKNVIAVEPQHAAQRVRGLDDKVEIKTEFRIKIVEAASKITGSVAVQGRDEVTEAVEVPAMLGGTLHQTPPVSPGRSTTIVPGLSTRLRAARAATAPVPLRW